MKTLALLPPTETMYRALVNRDASFEGIFFVGVRTTGIFCRPTCTAKKPARENVNFFATASEALEGGYRPCLSCHPLDTNAPPPKLIERLRAEVGGGFPEKVTAFHDEMAVHGRFKQPCPVCGSPVQRIVYAENECNYCATCQTEGRLLADRALSRLLKQDWPRSLEDWETHLESRR